MKDFLEQVSSFYLAFSLYHELPEDSAFSATCFRWDLKQIYDYGEHGAITVTLIPTIQLCDKALGRFVARYSWFNVLLLCCAIASFLLSLRSIRKRFLMLAEIRGMGDPSQGRHIWTSLNVTDRLKFVSLWTVGSLLSNILEIIACITFFCVSKVSLDMYYRVVGFGCFFAWVTTIKYLEWSPNSYAIINTLKRSFSTLWRYVLGILPIFMAFVFLAMTLFWKTGNYTDVSLSMITSFALLNGDTVYGFFSTNVDVNYLAGYLYMFIFLVLFITAIHNLFISIIGEGFDSLTTNPIKRGHESEELSSPRMKTDEESKREMSSKWYVEKKSKVRFRRLMNKNTVIADSSTSLAVSEMNDLMRQIREKLERLKELALPQEGVAVNQERLKEKLRSIIELSLKGTVITIENLSRDL